MKLLLIINSNNNKNWSSNIRNSNLKNIIIKIFNDSILIEK